MATVTDQLETALRMSGLPEYQAGLKKAEKSVQDLYKAEKSREDRQARVAAVGGGTSFLGDLVKFNIATRAFDLLGRAGSFLVKSFGDAEVAGVRLRAQMANLGNVFPADQLEEFAAGLSRVTGIDDELIAGLGATAAQFGLNRREIERLLPAVLDISQARGLDPDSVLGIILRASRGRSQGLVGLGIDPSKVRGDLSDIDNLAQQLQAHFQGTAAAVRQTLPGSLAALQTSVENLFEAIGRLFGGTAVTIINGLVKLTDNLTDLVNRLADHLESVGLISKREAPGTGTAGQLALKGDPEQTGLLGEIAENTKNLNERLVQRVLGGPGTVAERAVTWRDIPVAFGV